MEVVDINPYQIKSLKKSGFFLVLGRRGRGKTTWSKYIGGRMTDIQEGTAIVMVGSERVRESWSDSVPSLYIVDKSEEYLSMLCTGQDGHIKKYGKKAFPKRHHVYIFFDDCASDRKFMTSKVVKYLASNSRQLEITCFWLAQYIFQVPSEVRSQFDMIFTLATSSSKNIATIHGEFCSMIPLRIFRRILQALTENFGVLVIDVNGTTVSGTCMYLKMDTYPPVPIKMGSQQQWIFSKTHYLDLEKVKHRVKNEKSKYDMAVASDSESDDGVDDFFKENIDVLDNKRFFRDRIGEIVVRTTLAGPEKTKKD